MADSKRVEKGKTITRTLPLPGFDALLDAASDLPPEPWLLPWRIDASTPCERVIDAVYAWRSRTPPGDVAMLEKLLLLDLAMRSDPDWRRIPAEHYGLRPTAKALAAHTRYEDMATVQAALDSLQAQGMVSVLVLVCDGERHPCYSIVREALNPPRHGQTRRVSVG